MTSKAARFCESLLRPGVGSTDRPALVLAFAEGLADAEGATFWAVMKEEWGSFDLIPHEAFEVQFTRFADTAPGSTALDGIRLFRGQDGDAPAGLSWTSCATTAAGFARGHRGLWNKDPVILECYVSPSLVAFECHDRNESEYVLLNRPDLWDYLNKRETKRAVSSLG